MSKEVKRTITRSITKFIWDETSPMISMETLQLPIEKGGKGLLDLAARNKAIDLIQLKSFLSLGRDRLHWAKLADKLIARNIPLDQSILEEGKQANIFTQNWKTKLKGRSTLPESIKSMLKTAKKYNVELELLLPSTAL